MVNLTAAKFRIDKVISKLESQVINREFDRVGLERDEQILEEALTIISDYKDYLEKRLKTYKLVKKLFSIIDKSPE